MNKHNTFRCRYIGTFNYDLKMKLTTFLLMAMLFRINANTYSQNTRITIDMAAKGGYLKIVKYLEGLGANVNNEVPGDETPLINASEQGHLDIVKFLVEKGADVNQICSELYNGKTRERTALKMAEKNGHDSIVEYLKSQGAKN